MVHDIEESRFGIPGDSAFHIVYLGDDILREDFLGSSFVADLAVLQDVYPVAELGRQIQVVECAECGAPDALHDVEDLQLIFDVQVVCRFVEDETRSLLRQCAGQYDPLLLPSG